MKVYAHIGIPVHMILYNVSWIFNRIHYCRGATVTQKLILNYMQLMCRGQIVYNGQSRNLGYNVKVARCKCSLVQEEGEVDVQLPLPMNSCCYCLSLRAGCYIVFLWSLVSSHSWDLLDISTWCTFRMRYVYKTTINFASDRAVFSRESDVSVTIYVVSKQMLHWLHKDLMIKL